jgi:hypothetical protein
VITRPLSWSESRTGRVMQTFSPQTGNFAHFLYQVSRVSLENFGAFFSEYTRAFCPTMPVISFLYFHNYPGAFIKTCKFELMLLCQAGPSSIVDPILFFPVPALDPDLEFLFQFCIRIPTIFSSFSNKFVGYNILRLNVRNVRYNVSMETFVILAKSSGSDLFRIWFWFHNYGAMVSFD